MNADRVTHEDALVGLGMFGPGFVDAIVTDPPWPGCAIDTGWGGDTWWATIVEEMERVTGPRGKILVILGSQCTPRILAPFTRPFVSAVWLPYVRPRYRGNVLNTADVGYEFGSGFLPRGRRLLACQAPPVQPRWPAGESYPTWHPCPRSQAHMDWLLRARVGPGRVVVDPFAGSGTTIVAAARAGATAYGFDRNEGYVHLANERIEADRLSVPVTELREGQLSLLNPRTAEIVRAEG